MKYIALDIETTDLHGTQILGYGLARADVRDVAHSFEWNTGNIAYLLQHVENANKGLIKFVFHNAKFDVSVLRKHGIDIQPGTYEDTQVLSWVWDPSEGRYGLDECCSRYGIPGKFDKPESWSEWDEYMAEYCKQDAVSTINLFHKVRNLLETDTKALSLYENIELPYIECIMEFEATGFLVDIDKLNSMIQDLEMQAWRLKEEIVSYYPAVPSHLIVRNNHYVPYRPKSTVRYKKGVYNKIVKEWSEVVKVPHGAHSKLVEFNVNSRAHLSYVLYQLYGIESDKKTKTGKPQTNAEELEKIDGDYPLVKKYLEYAKLHKLLSSFLYKFDQLKDEDNVVRASFNQTGTVTGRLSSSNPNFQNIPVEGEIGQQIRSLFVAPAGYNIVGIDLSNIEGRVLAHYLSMVFDDNAMRTIFENDEDFHQSNADNWKVTRREAKTLLYASAYGAGPKKIGGGDVARGKQLLHSLETNAPGIGQLKQMIWEWARNNDGVIHDNFGRRLVYRDIIWDNAIIHAQDMIDSDTQNKLFTSDVRELAKFLMSECERQIFNAVLQGTAASVLKILTLFCFENRGEHEGIYFIAPVHDELQMYCPTDWSESWSKNLEIIFASPLLSHCPIKGESKVGKSWMETH